MPTVLFLCSGNYYRSRFAEVLFNHLAAQGSHAWKASSRGLRVRHESGNVGPISVHAVTGLAARGIGLSDEDATRMPRQVIETEFAAADLVVALKQAEHRAMMIDRFPAWVERIRYWHIHDLDAATPQDALADLESQVRQLFIELQGRPA